ncbi:MAG TPA: fused MFS/spermidine synthase [Polyangiaceae bacterium]|nr:fused MFS/spermidine synthase [Polyangiaceae bacterium]
MTATLRVSASTLPVFAAAALLFAIEPMLGKLLLPALGGSPATWAACLVAFQVLLLLGYGYAYAGARWLSVRQQVLVHAGLVVVAVAVLLKTRLALPPVLEGLLPALAVPWLIARRVGLPFVVLASSTPLAARWAAAQSGSRPGIYAVSNAGSLLGLLAYPLLLERFVALPAQLALWAAAFVLVGLSWVGLCTLLLRGEVNDTRVMARPTPWRRRLHWLALSAVPSALLVAITNYITVDVAAAPLLWVVPLALYLTSFVVAFSSWSGVARGPALGMWLVGCAWLALNALGQGAVPLAQQLLAAFLALSGGALLCHGELARRAPVDADASGFYVVLALGGALGGSAVSLLAPLLLSDFYELELASVAVFALLAPLVRRGRAAEELPRVGRLALLLGAGLCLPLLAGEAWARHQASGRGGQVIERRRSFLGPLKVVDTKDGRLLLHGRIQHGMQLREPELRRTPTMYFGAGTAVARVLQGAPDERPRRWGVVGLGVGTLASYAGPRDDLRFYELDPHVIDLARRDFTFLKDARGSVIIVEGDGRLALAHEAPQAFDVLVLDAFTSDAVPVHLLTHEAFEIYARQLAPHGMLLANVSNRHLAVDRVVRASAHAVGLTCEIVDTPTRAAGHITHVTWAVMARDRERLEEVLGDLPRSRPTKPDVLWTDSRASLLSVLR